MATDKNSGAGESTSPLADRLFARSGRARGIGAGSSLFRRLGLENPYEGGAIEDASAGGKEMFSFLSSKAYFDELRGLSAVRRHLMWRIESIRHRIRAGDRFDKPNRAVASSAVRAAMLGFDRSQAQGAMTLVDWSTQVDPVAAAPAEVAAQRPAASRAAVRSTRATAAERALRNQISQASEVLAELQEVVRGLPQAERSSMDGHVRALTGMSERGQLAGARQAVRRLRGVSAVSARGSRIVSESRVLGERPLAVAQGRIADPTATDASAASAAKGLRRVLASSPIAMTLEQPEAERSVPVSTEAAQVRPAIERAHAHRDVPVASVAREVRNQSATGRAGPPRSEGAVAHPAPRSVSALSAPRPTERIARKAIQTQTAPLNDLRRGLTAAGVIRPGRSTSAVDATSRLEQRVAARAEAGLPDARGHVMAGFAHARMDASSEARPTLAVDTDTDRRAPKSIADRRDTPAMTGLVARPEASTPDATAAPRPVADPNAPSASTRPSGRPSRVFRTERVRTETQRPAISQAHRTQSAAATVSRPLPPIARAVHRAVSSEGTARRLAASAPASHVGLASSPVVRARAVDRRDVGTSASDVGSERAVSRTQTLAAASVPATSRASSPVRPVAMSVARPEAPQRDSEPQALTEGARGALRSVVSEGPSRRGRALPTVRAASRALAQERSGARGRMLSPSSTAHVAVRSSSEALSSTLLVRDGRSAGPARPADPGPVGPRRAQAAREEGRRGALGQPEARPSRLGTLARASVRSLPVERVGEAGRMLSPRAVAAQDVEAGPARVLEVARMAHLTSAPADLSDRAGRGIAPTADSREPGSPAARRASVGGRTTSLAEGRERAASSAARAAGRLDARRPSDGDVRSAGRGAMEVDAATLRSDRGISAVRPPASRAILADRTSRPEFVLAQPARPADASVRDGLASRATDRASEGSNRSALPAVTPEHGRNAARRSEARRADSLRAVAGRDERASSRRVEAAREGSPLARSTALRTPGSPTEATFGHRTVSGIVERSIAQRTPTGRTERSEGWLTPAEALTRTAGRQTDAGATARSRAIAPDARVLRPLGIQVPSDEGTVAHAVRRANLPDDAHTVFARPAPAAEVRGDAGIRTGRPVGASTVPRGRRTPSLRAVGRTASRLAERSVVPRPVGDEAGDRQVLRQGTLPLVEGTLARPQIARVDTEGLAARASFGSESVAGGARGTPARPGAPSRSRMERALRAASVHAGERSTPTVLTLAAPQRALGAESTHAERPSGAQGRRFTARIEQDAEGRVVRSTLVDEATGLTFAGPAAGASDLARPSTWAEERGNAGIARSRERVVRSDSRIARDARGRTVSAEDGRASESARAGGVALRSLDGAARGLAPESVFASRSTPERAGIGLDGALGALTHGGRPSATPQIERRPLLRRRAWQRRGMAAELGTLAPALADADYAPTQALPEGSPSWVQRAVHGTSADGVAPVAPEARSAARPRDAAPEARPNRLMSALSRADTPQDLVQVIVQRGSEVASLRNELPSEALRIVERIATLGPEEVAVLRRGRVLQADASRTLSRNGSSRNRKTASEPNMLSAGHDGMGPNRITKLADKLMNLIHLAENSRKREAQDQVRMANVEPSAASAESGAKSPGMSVENYDMNIRALEVAVLNSMMEAKEDLNARNPEEPDGRSKWF